MTVGNQAQTSMAEVAEALLEDERVTALGLHIEGSATSAAFEAMASPRARLGKRIVALKAGASEQARTAALSHTGALAGSDAGARALLDRLGIARVETLTQMLETLKILHLIGPLPSNRIASMSCSGGEAGPDGRHARSGSTSRFHPWGGAATRLREALGEQGRAGQPARLPHLRLGRPRRHRADLHRDDAGRSVHGCRGGSISPAPDRCDASAWDLVIEAVRRHDGGDGRPMAILRRCPRRCRRCGRDADPPRDRAALRCR
jgi:hypothetical protein